jgi:hypothetical protein
MARLGPMGLPLYPRIKLEARGVSKILSRRAHVILPVEVVADIDKLVGKRGRSAFLTELARREIKLRHQRQVLRETFRAGKTEDHPELTQGATAWMQQIRALDNHVVRRSRTSPGREMTYLLDSSVLIDTLNDPADEPVFSGIGISAPIALAPRKKGYGLP